MVNPRTTPASILASRPTAPYPRRQSPLLNLLRHKETPSGALVMLTREVLGVIPPVAHYGGEHRPPRDHGISLPAAGTSQPDGLVWQNSGNVGGPVSTGRGQRGD